MFVLQLKEKRITQDITIEWAHRFPPNKKPPCKTVFFRKM